MFTISFTRLKMWLIFASERLLLSRIDWREGETKLVEELWRSDTHGKSEKSFFSSQFSFESQKRKTFQDFIFLTLLIDFDASIFEVGGNKSLERGEQINFK